jgi:ATP-dependent RNA helicase RhlE
MRTKQGCSRLTRELQRAGIKADAIHGDKSQLERIKALEAFKGGETDALIATDVAARGLDVDDLPYVINYELPHTPEDYVHRIGRTGRAGKMGNAISLVSAHEVCYLVDIEKLIKASPIEQVEVAGFEPEPEYEYPPGNKKKRQRPAGHQGPGRQRPERSANAPSAANVPEPRERGERNDRQERRPRRNPMIAADGFDFSKPYEDIFAARRSAGFADRHHAKVDPHKPKRVVAALLGGLGRK